MSGRRVQKRTDRSKMSLLVGSVITLLILTIGVALITSYIQKSNEKKLEVQSEISSEVIENDITLEHEQKENAMFSSDITFPITGSESIDKEVEEWIRSIESNFHDTVDTSNYKKKSKKAKLLIETELSKSTDSIYQFIIQAEEEIKDDKNKKINTWLIDQEEESIISFADVFNQEHLLQDEDFTAHLNDRTIKQLKENKKLPFSTDGSSLSIYEVNRDKTNWSKISIPLMDIYKQINVKYEDAIVSDELQNEIDEIKAEEERKKAEEEAKREEEEEQEENNTEQTPLGDKKYIALTFDDGPHESVTDQILATLDEYDAKATFFMLGQNAAKYPEIAKRVADTGHEIANHSISHPDLATLSADNIREQLATAKQQITDATGKTPIYFRPPYGSYNDTVLEIAQDTNQKVMLWSVDTRDWESRNPASINEVVQTYASPGSILLMHDIHASTADALPQMLEYLSSQGYEFVTLSELMPYLEENGVGPYRGF